MGCSVRRVTIGIAIALLFCALLPLRAFALEGVGSPAAPPEASAQNEQQVEVAQAEPPQKSEVPKTEVTDDGITLVNLSSNEQETASEQVKVGDGEAKIDSPASEKEPGNKEELA